MMPACCLSQVPSYSCKLYQMGAYKETVCISKMKPLQPLLHCQKSFSVVELHYNEDTDLHIKDIFYTNCFIDHQFYRSGQNNTVYLNLVLTSKFSCWWLNPKALNKQEGYIVMNTCSTIG